MRVPTEAGRVTLERSSESIPHPSASRLGPPTLSSTPPPSTVLHARHSMLGPTSLSDVLGWASIISWLGAQFPQVLENMRRQSADGLALPFLLNWALGDATNFIGCILTHQLPFQTYLSAYFCFVDFCLLSQFFYYRHKTPSKPPYLSIRSRTTSTATAHRLSIEREATHYRALSNVAANVAATAALLAEQEEHARRHRHSLERIPHSAVEARELLTAEEDDDVDEEGLARLADSFHSEGGRTGRRKKVSWSQERGGSVGRAQGPLSPSGRAHPALHMSPQPEFAEPESLGRGRSLSREVVPEDDAPWSPSQRRSSRASRKSASMVFLGVWALFGVGTLLSSQRGLPPTTALSRSGRVLSRAETAQPPYNNDVPYVYTSTHPDYVDVDLPTVFDETEHTHFTTTANQQEHSLEFIIGRISAWICTTLYLSSRLPQIWKNFVRKSVEGLSVYLFVFAFMGNVFYVASILTSPKLAVPEPQASAYLRESIPYLLGSGGTLMFDITIVTQTFIYKPKAHRGRRSSRSLSAEEEGLLSAGATGTEDMSTPSRRRTGMSAG